MFAFGAAKYRCTVPLAYVSIIHTRLTVPPSMAFVPGQFPVPAQRHSAAGHPPSHHGEVFRGSSGGVVDSVGDAGLCRYQLVAGKGSCWRFRRTHAKREDGGQNGERERSTSEDCLSSDGFRRALYLNFLVGLCAVLSGLRLDPEIKLKIEFETTCVGTRHVYRVQVDRDVVGWSFRFSIDSSRTEPALLQL